MFVSVSLQTSLVRLCARSFSKRSMATSLTNRESHMTEARLTSCFVNSSGGDEYMNAGQVANGSALNHACRDAKGLVDRIMMVPIGLAVKSKVTALQGW